MEDEHVVDLSIHKKTSPSQPAKSESGLSRVLETIDKSMPGAATCNKNNKSHPSSNCATDATERVKVQGPIKDEVIDNSSDSEVVRFDAHRDSDRQESDTDASKTGCEDDEEDDCDKKSRSPISGRGVTLPLLVQDGIICPGSGVVSIDYLGNKFRADLLEDGRIQEGTEVYNSPSAWAIACKKIVNPNKKSGCGWASVKYKGKKLDAYKSAWFRKHRSSVSTAGHQAASPDHEPEEKKVKLGEDESVIVEKDGPINLTLAATQNIGRRVSVSYASLDKKGVEDDPRTLVMCTTFESLNKIQPFTISVTSNTLLLMDFHAHLTTSEVAGYLAGRWDANTQQLNILQAFPCRCRMLDRENAPLVEAEIRKSMERQGLTCLGWYHSHPRTQPDPSLHDITAQMEYQLKLKGTGNTYLPCVGFIVSPFDPNEMRKLSRMRAYYVMPPPESQPHYYGVPMHMDYDVVQDLYLTQDVLDEIKYLSDFFKYATDLIDLSHDWYQGSTFKDKLIASLASHLPKDQTSSSLFEYIQKALTV